MYELYNRNRVILHKSIFTNNAVIKPRGAHIYIPEMYCTAMTSIQNGIRENPYQHKQNCVDN